MAARDDQSQLADALREFLASATAADPVPRGSAAPHDGGPTRSSSAAPARSLADALDEVIADEVRTARERAETRESRWRTAALWLMLVVLTGASGYVWFGNPAFLARPIEPIARPSTPVDARRTLVSISLLIDDFRTTAGRLPQSLTELEVAAPDIGYIAHGNREYELRLGSGVHTMVLRGGTGQAELELEERTHD